MDAKTTAEMAVEAAERAIAIALSGSAASAAATFSDKVEMTELDEDKRVCASIKPGTTLQRLGAPQV